MFTGKAQYVGLIFALIRDRPISRIALMSPVSRAAAPKAAIHGRTAHKSPAGIAD
jgi:hypothetical protein